MSGGSHRDGASPRPSLLAQGGGWSCYPICHTTGGLDRVSLLSIRDVRVLTASDLRFYRSTSGRIGHEKITVWSRADNPPAVWDDLKRRISPQIHVRLKSRGFS